MPQSSGIRRFTGKWIFIISLYYLINIFFDFNTTIFIHALMLFVITRKTLFDPIVNPNFISFPMDQVSIWLIVSLSHMARAHLLCLFLKTTQVVLNWSALLQWQIRWTMRYYLYTSVHISNWLRLASLINVWQSMCADGLDQQVVHFVTFFLLLLLHGERAFV